jgi:hypothetical protein
VLAVDIRPDWVGPMRAGAMRAGRRPWLPMRAHSPILTKASIWLCPSYPSALWRATFRPQARSFGWPAADSRSACSIGGVCIGAGREGRGAVAAFEVPAGTLCVRQNGFSRSGPCRGLAFARPSKSRAGVDWRDP